MNAVHMHKAAIDLTVQAHILFESENKTTFGDNLCFAIASITYSILNLRYLTKLQLRFHTAISLSQEKTKDDRTTIININVRPQKCRTMEVFWIIYKGEGQNFDTLFANYEGYSLYLRNNNSEALNLEIYCYLGEGLFAKTNVTLGPNS